MKRMIALISGFFVLSTQSAYPQEKLVPVSSVFDMGRHSRNYALTLNKRLFNKKGEWFGFRYFVKPSFEKEYFLGFGRRDSVCYVLYRVPRVPKQNVWYSGRFYKKNPPKDYSFDITEVRKRIAPASADLLMRLFRGAVFNAEFIKPKITEGMLMTAPKGVDGTTYYFSIGGQTAEVWSPRKGSATNELVGILEEVVRQMNAGNETIDLDVNTRERIVRLTEKYPLPVYVPE